MFFMHSSVEGHLGFFHVLAIVKNVAVDIESMYLFKLEKDNYHMISFVESKYRYR